MTNQRKRDHLMFALFRHDSILRRARGEIISARFPCTGLMLLCLLATAPPASASDPAAAVRAAVQEVQRIHQRDGMAGLEVASRACWEEEAGFRCLHLDVAAGTLDGEFAEAMGIGVHTYFAVEPLLRRIGPVFARSRWDMETSNSYLQFLDGAVRGVMEEGPND